MPRECNGLKSICDSFPHIYSHAVVVKMRSLSNLAFEGRCISSSISGLTPEKKNTELLQRSVILKMLEGSASLYKIKIIIGYFAKTNPKLRMIRLGLSGGSDYDSSDVELDFSDLDEEIQEDSLANVDNDEDEVEVVEVDPSLPDLTTIENDADIDSEYLELVDTYEEDLIMDPITFFIEAVAGTLLTTDYVTPQMLEDEGTKSALQGSEQEDGTSKLTPAQLKDLEKASNNLKDEQDILDILWFNKVVDVIDSDGKRLVAQCKSLDATVQLLNEELKDEKDAKVIAETNAKIEAYKKTSASYTKLAKYAKVSKDLMLAHKDELCIEKFTTQINSVTKDHPFTKDESIQMKNRFLSNMARNVLLVCKDFGKIEAKLDEVDPSKTRINRFALYEHLLGNNSEKDLDKIYQRSCAEQAIDILSSNDRFKNYNFVLKDDHIHVSRKSETEKNAITANISDLKAGSSNKSIKESEKMSLISRYDTAKYIKMAVNKIDEMIKYDQAVLDKSRRKSGAKNVDRYTFFNNKLDAFKKNMQFNELPSRKGEALNKVESSTKDSIPKAKTKEIVKNILANVKAKQTTTDKVIQEGKDARKKLVGLAKTTQEAMETLKMVPPSKNAKEYRKSIRDRYMSASVLVKEAAVAEAKKIIESKESKNPEFARHRSIQMRRATTTTSVITAAKRGLGCLYIKKIGDNSVGVEGVIDVDFDPAHSNVGQNIFAFTKVRVYDVRDKIGWDNQSYEWQMNTRAFMNYVNGPLRSKNYHNNWERFIAQSQVPEKLSILHGVAEEKDKIDTTNATDYIKSGMVIQNRPVADSLAAQLELSKPVAETIACKLTQNLVRYNNRTLFFQGVMLACMLHDLEVSGLQWEYREDEINNITFANLNPPQGQQHLLAATIDRINEKGSFAFDKRYTSEHDISIMSLLTSGPSAIRINSPLVHVTQTFEISRPNFAVYGMNLANPAYRLTRITSGQVWAFLVSLAENQGMRTDFVEGCLLACRIMNGHVKSNGATNEFFTCTLECKKIVLPRPHAHNFMWRVINQEPKEKVNDHLMSEFDELKTQSVDDFQVISVVVSALLSMGVSLVFHKYNITGREVNDLQAAAIQSPNIHWLLQQLFDISNDADRSSIFCFACSAISQTTGASVNSSAFKGSSWSASMTWTRRLLTPRDLWQRHWNKKIPYMFNPIILGPFLTGLPAEWGLSKPEMSLDIKKECVLRGYRETSGWYCSLGDATYDKYLSEGMGYNFISYGVMSINFLLQHQPFNLVRNGRVTINISLEVRSHSGQSIITLNLLVGNDFQPEYDADIPHIIPGTLPTWDHAAQHQIVPFILAEDMPADFFEIISSITVIKSQYAGIKFEVLCTATISVDYGKMGQKFEGMKIFAKGSRSGTSGSKFGKTEN